MKYKLGQTILIDIKDKFALDVNNNMGRMLAIVSGKYTDTSITAHLISAEDYDLLVNWNRDASGDMVIEEEDVVRVVKEPEWPEIQVGDMVSDNCQHTDESSRRYGIVTKIDNHEQLVVMNSHNCFCLRMHKSSWDKQPSDKKFEAQRKLWKAWQDTPDKHADYPDDTKPMKCPGTEQSNFATCDDSGGIPAQEPKKEEEILITDLLESKITSQPGMFIGRFMDFESGKQGVEIILADGSVVQVYNSNLVKSKMNKDEWIDSLLRSYKSLRSRMDGIVEATSANDDSDALDIVREEFQETSCEDFLNEARRMQHHSCCPGNTGPLMHDIAKQRQENATVKEAMKLLTEACDKINKVFRED